MLAMRDVQLQYEGVSILRDINLNVGRGQVVVILGPNGVGKSSLLKVASGENRPHAGEVRLHGVTLQDVELAQKAHHMAVLPQHSALNFAYSVEEVVLLGRTPHATGLAADRAIAAEALARVDGSYLAGRLYTRLSGGEKQRVQLARVLAQVWQPVDGADRLLILDEPTSALDYAHQKLVANLLRERADSGCSVLTAMHDLNLAASCGDCLVLLQCGEILAMGSPQEVLQEPLLKQVFQVDFHRITHPQTGKPWLLN